MKETIQVTNELIEELKKEFENAKKLRLEYDKAMEALKGYLEDVCKDSNKQ